MHAHRRQSRLLQRSDGTCVQGLSAASRDQRADDGDGISATRLQSSSGGTDNHLFLLDLINKKITGKAAEAAIARTSRSIKTRCRTIPGNRS